MIYEKALWLLVAVHDGYFHLPSASGILGLAQLPSSGRDFCREKPHPQTSPNFSDLQYRTFSLFPFSPHPLQTYLWVEVVLLEQPV